jgi:hypothetical protein
MKNRGNGVTGWRALRGEIAGLSFLTLHFRAVFD